jgi:hypothetical protein
LRWRLMTQSRSPKRFRRLKTWRRAWHWICRSQSTSRMLLRCMPSGTSVAVRAIITSASFPSSRHAIPSSPLSHLLFRSWRKPSRMRLIPSFAFVVATFGRPESSGAPICSRSKSCANSDRNSRAFVAFWRWLPSVKRFARKPSCWSRASLSSALWCAIFGNKPAFPTKSLRKLATPKRYDIQSVIDLMQLETIYKGQRGRSHVFVSLGSTAGAQTQNLFS